MYFIVAVHIKHYPYIAMSFLFMSHKIFNIREQFDKRAG